jgi:hypothetical protein
MDVARKALSSLDHNAGAGAILGSNGPDAASIKAIAENNPAYVALGAIGPDIFFLLPDFKPPVGTMLWGAANTIKDLYTWWDDNFLSPYEDQLGPIFDNLSDQVNAVTGGLANQLSDIFSRAFKFLLDTVVVMATRQYDVFSFLGSGVPEGYDEQVFFWSDMLHYRKTYEFAAHLWQKAHKAGNERMMAFALGWMSHLATDVTGHCFVNEKSGGPYRLHWQRHHLVENHMDAKVYDTERGSEAIYQMISAAALHLWIAFNPDGSSRENFFANQPGPNYATGDDTPSILDRKSKWDVDSNIPDDLAQFLAEALKEVYNPAVMRTADSKGACADHPTIISDLSPGSDGYPSKDDIITTYWWLFKYVKFTTTDFFDLLRPKEPDVFTIPPFPSPPGSGESDPGPGPSDDSAWHDFLEVLLAIFAWILYLGEIASWPAAALAGLIAGAGTYPIRELLYENLELPLYNAWLALHWYLAMTGFVYPMQQEINMGIMTLGVGVTDVWGTVQAGLNDLSGGLHAAPQTATEPSGRDRDPITPHDVVTDPPGFVSALIHGALNNNCGAREAPSEFIRPWLFPTRDNQSDIIPSEHPDAPASPYKAMQDATALMGGLPGNPGVRGQLEGSPNEATTIKVATAHLPLSETLGDPVDYTGYVVARLTRNDPGNIANFNLDSDRGYGYLCWDWVRSKEIMAIPAAFKGKANERRYHAPLRPGFGWCDQDLAPGTLPAQGSPDRPTMHDPTITDNDTVAGRVNPVTIRYIDREDKFR